MERARTMILRAEREYKGFNKTRWYSTIHPRRNGEARIRTWAVKTWKGKPLIFLAAEYNTDGSTNHVSGRCLINNYIHAPAFNWLDYGGKKHLAVWSDVDTGRDGWYKDYPHQFGKGTEFHGKLLNNFANTRYQYFAYEKSHKRITDFIDLCRQSPKTELIIKAGLLNWLTPSAIRKLDTNKPLARFVARNAARLKEASVRSTEYIYRRYGEKSTPEQILTHDMVLTYGLADVKIPEARIARWFSLHQNVRPEDLRHHIDNLRELKMSLDYEPHILPHDWDTYHLDIEDRVMEARELAEAMEQAAIREARAEARKQIDEWLKSGKIHKRFKIVIPSTETELINESEVMHNCVRTYGNRIKKGNCALFFIRKDGKPYIDLEVGRNGNIVQARYDHNRDVRNGEHKEDEKLCNLIATSFRMAA